MTPVLDKIILGTANWGVSVTKIEAYKILTVFYQNGYRWVDTATNYPIDKNSNHYMACIGWIHEFLPDFPEINCFIKVGSATNLGDSDALMSISYFELIFENLYAKFGKNLGGLGIHWDHGTKKSEREKLIQFFEKIYGMDMKVGLSGLIKSEDYSKDLKAKVLPWLYQTNIYQATEQDLNLKVKEIKNFFPNSFIYGYSLMGGNRTNQFGLKNKRPENLNSLLKNVLSSSIDGVIVGPKNIVQCKEWIEAIECSIND